MTSILVALAAGFLLGILVMVLLVSGRHDEELVDRVERREKDATRKT